MDSGRQVPVQTATTPPPRCKRLPATATHAERRELHRQKMAAKRRRLMSPGFTPVRNKRIADAVQAMMLLVKLENPNLSPVDVEETAIRRVAARLPAPPTGHRSWYNRPPTKNANPEYRRGNRP